MNARLIVVCTPAIFVLLWSTGFIGSKLGAPYAEPMVFLTIRFALVIPLMALLCMVMKRDWPRDPQLIFHCLITGMLVHGIYLGGVFWAIDRGMPAGVSAVMIGLQPAVTAFAAILLIGERVGLRHWIGILIGAIGLGMVLGPRLSIAGSGIGTATILAVLCSVAAISIGTVYQKRFVPKTDLLPATTWQYAGALLVTLPLTALESWQVTWSGEFVFALLWLVFVLSIGAILLLMFLIRKGEVSRVASLFYLVPAATAIESYFLFGETLSVLQICGTLLVIAAIMAIQLAPSAK